MTSLPLSLLDHRKWLIAVLVVALVPFFTACPPDRPDDPAIIDPDMEEMPVTSVAALTAPDAERLEGRDVQLMNVRIVEVVGDTAFYVTDDMPPAPGVADPQVDPGMEAQPDATPPGATPADPARPGQERPGVGMEDRVLVVYDRGLLNGIVGQDDPDDAVRVGARVNVFGEVRTWNDARGLAAPRPTPMENDAVTPQDQRDPVQPQVAPGAPGAERVYVAADRVEPADAAPRPGGPADRGAPGDDV